MFCTNLDPKKQIKLVIDAYMNRSHFNFQEHGTSISIAIVSPNIILETKTTNGSVTVLQ